MRGGGTCSNELLQTVTGMEIAQRGSRHVGPPRGGAPGSDPVRAVHWVPGGPAGGVGATDCEGGADVARAREGVCDVHVQGRKTTLGFRFTP
ncbi:MAG: hypothetical protein [Microviridae sp.]|nr:MAG: hypothetical protein [Microviridae sp.]